MLNQSFQIWFEFFWTEIHAHSFTWEIWEKTVHSIAMIAIRSNAEQSWTILYNFSYLPSCKPTHRVLYRKSLHPAALFRQHGWDPTVLTCFKLVQSRIQMVLLPNHSQQMHSAAQSLTSQKFRFHQLQGSKCRWRDLQHNVTVDTTAGHHQWGSYSCRSHLEYFSAILGWLSCKLVILAFVG